MNAQNNFIPFSNTTKPKLRTILAKHARRVDGSLNDMVALHTRGFREKAPIYLSDGTMLTDVGASTLIQHPDNRLAVVFSPNPDKVRRVTTRLDTEGRPVDLKRAGVGETQGLIVVSARECDEYGLQPSWVNDAIVKHNALVSASNGFHGILKRTNENMWRSESVIYEVKEFKNKGKSDEGDGLVTLSCGYGVGISIDALRKKDTIQKKLRNFYKRLNRDKVNIKKSDSYIYIKNHFLKVSPKIVEGFSPRHITFKKGYETYFSEAIRKKNQSKGLIRRALGYVGLKAALVTTGVLSVGFILISGALKAFRAQAIGSLMRSIPAVAWQLATRQGLKTIMAASAAVFLLSAYFVSNLIAGSKDSQSQIWKIGNSNNASNSFYEEKKDPNVLRLRYQVADSKQVEEAMALNVLEYNSVPADSKIYEEEPEEYSMNRLYSTKSIQKGSLMEEYNLNAHRIAYYNERNGLRRISVPDLKTTFVTYAEHQEGDLEVSRQEKKILDEGEVIKITLNETTNKLERVAMKYNEFEENILLITQQSYRDSVIFHPDHDEYMEKKREERERKRLANRVRSVFSLQA